MHLPVMIQHLIEAMSDQRNSYHIRNNYRNTLARISEEIQKSVQKFDTSSIPNKKKQR